VKTNPTRTVDELLTILTYVIDIEAGKEIFHSWRVAVLSALFARGLLNTKKTRNAFYAGLLHDIGGVGFPFHITHYLQRNNRLSQSILLSHPIIGAQLISNIPQMNTEAQLVLDHHEWINGRGYPGAKTRCEIALESQIIRMADAIDILLQSGHPYTLSKLKRTMSPHVNKEYTKNLFEHAFRMLKKEDFYQRIRDQHTIAELFKETKKKMKLMRIPPNIDAVGKTLEAFAQIIDMKHPYASGHSLRVSRYALAIALAMNLHHDEITRIKWAGLIHDIGKITVSREVLNKRTKLNKREFHEIKKHAQFTQDILDMISSLKEIVPIAAGHHEYFDGSGYPRGLKSAQIPLGAKILTVCDAFDAMTSNRPYRNPLSPKLACQELQKLAGKQFDPDVVKKAVPLFRTMSL
jgi:HD-GYP domain-containing protein (c-di-GMP phosphodiesterase class II)